MTNEEKLAKITPPESKEYELMSVDQINHRPHIYCLTPKHIEHCADNHSGILTEAAIDDAEKAGVHCGMFVMPNGDTYNSRKSGSVPCTIPRADHKCDTVLFIKALADKPVGELEGINEYLVSIKYELAELGIDGAAFVKG